MATAANIDALEATSASAGEVDLGARVRDALSGVYRALGAMRGAGTPTKLVERACVELCRSCGFDRALAFRVEGSRLILAAAHFRYDSQLAVEVIALGRRTPPRLVHPLLEAEMLRRRAAVLVGDPQNDPRTYKPLVLATGTTSYVASPIQPQGRVIGFLHADCHDAGRRVDSLDRDTLAAFSEGFGYALERSLLLERLKTQRRRLRPLLSSAEAILDEYRDAELELSGAEGDSVEPTRGLTVMSHPQSRINALLTRREIEVLRLMASGATNALIAERLVISEGTVKSHVKHILRKLRVANRAEAVSRFMRIDQLDHDSF